MKKILALVLMVVLSLSIIGCAKDETIKVPENTNNDSASQITDDTSVPEEKEKNVGVTSSNEMLVNDLKFFEGENLLGVVVLDFLTKADKAASIEVVFEDELTKEQIQNNEFYNIIFSDEVTQENRNVVTISKYENLQVSGE